ncbi:MAG TPA: RNA polymerase factor sigma-54 [Thermoanaerobaculia bacterium]|nr:RNA polymerase factor sigma-54 [Thermoanaerobaculia bacterium]
MALEQKLSLKLSQRLVMTPSLQQAIKMLQMTRLELSEAVNQEVIENPVLEDAAEEEETAAATPTPEPEAPPAPEAPEPQKDAFEEIDYESYFQDYMDSGYNPRQFEEREEIPLENTLAEQPDLAEYLTWQLGMSAAKGPVLEVGNFLIGNIDEDGYLQVSREEIERAGPWDASDVDAALEIVRGFDPPGIAAYDLPDCLRRQVTALGIENEILDRILTTHWKLFLNRQFAALAKELNVPMSELQTVLTIVKNLETKPGRRYASDRTVYVQPDVVVRKVDGEYIVILDEDGLPRLRISNSYRRMLHSENGSLGAEAKEYLKERMRSAVWLIKSLDQRQRTIYKVAESIVAHQKEFLDKGIEFLRPLVLRDVANDIGMHESTVSRVVSNKYMQTPRGILPMKYFFHTGIDSSEGEDVSSLSIKNKISKMISDEDPRKPLSDAKLMQRLRAEGIQIARRTVAKYREELRLASSSQRKALF